MIGLSKNCQHGERDRTMTSKVQWKWKRFSNEKSEQINFYSTSKFLKKGVALKAKEPFETSWLEINSNWKNNLLAIQEKPTLGG